MRDPVKTLLWTVGTLSFIGCFLFVVPSFMGMLMCLILWCVCIDIALRRRRTVASDLNSAIRAVCHDQGSVAKVAVAFSRSGPLSGACYEFARRLTVGEAPLEAASAARIPLQLRTAIALESPAVAAADLREERDVDPINEAIGRDDSAMPAYAQLLYLTISAAVTCLVLSFIVVFIVPSIEVMFDEFGLYNRYAALMTSVPATVLLVFLVLSLLIAIPILRRGRLFGIELGNHFPLLPSVAQQKADQLRGIADALDAGWPIGRALTVGHVIATRRNDRYRIESAMTFVQRGAVPATALREAGWISPREEAWLLDTTSQQASQLLRVIADQTVRDAACNLRWVMSIIYPAIVLILGLIVMAFSFAFIGTLMGLVGGLS